MVQFTIEYVALGFAILLVLGGLLALFSFRSNRAGISPIQRVALLGGLVGMLAFIIAAAFWRLR
jgi:hypothetical protein